jgi:rhamnosyltransferase
LSAVSSNVVGIVLTTYHPDLADLPATLRKLRNQSENVVVCDNSEYPVVADAVRQLCESAQLAHYISMNGNRGIAAAQNKGISWLFSKDCRYVLEMDQDGSVGENYVECMFNAHQTLDHKAVAGIGALSVDLNAAREASKPHCLEGASSLVKTSSCLSTGFFFSREAFHAVGPKDESLFIDYVDWEWCWRARREGRATYLHTGLHVTHRLGEKRMRLGFCSVGIPAPVRHYYQYRNSISLMRRSYVPLRWKLERSMVNLAKLPFYALMLRDCSERRRYISDGVRHALDRKTGKYLG